MLIAPKPGLFFDQPPLAPAAFWNLAVNVRFRLGNLETIGLFGPLRDVNDDQIALPGTQRYRKIYTTPSTTTGQILAGSSDTVQLIEYDPASTPAQGTRWRTFDVTPAALAAASDTLPNPSAGRVEIPPVWWFSDQDDVVVGSRANVAGEPAYAWDRNPLTDFAPLANSPTGAVGGGIINRILVLLGCTSFTDPDPQRFMTVRWSDRFNFEDWTPSDINISGELQLEGGSRIVGGGVTGFGVIAWTDRRMALLQETGNPSTVFSRKYIDGGRGMVANNAWCEADGRIWWLDEARQLNVFDGGRPRQVPNPLKLGTIERLEDRQTARIWVQPNTEYGEIIIGYPDANDENPDAQLVYNYVEDAWSLWRLNRTAWTNRYGVINNLAVDDAGLVYRHDRDLALPDDFVSGPTVPASLAPFPPVLSPDATVVSADEVTPFDFQVHTNLVTTENVSSQSWKMTRVNMDHLPMPSLGAEGDTLTVQLTAYGEGQLRSALIAQDHREFTQGENLKDFRVGGKAIQTSIYGKQIRSVYRFSGFVVTDAEDGIR